MSPPTSPRTVYVDKISSRRKANDLDISTTTTNNSSDKTLDNNEIVQFSGEENNDFSQNVRLTSSDTYKRFV